MKKNQTEPRSSCTSLNTGLLAAIKRQLSAPSESSIALCGLLLLLISTLRAIHAPNLWSATQATWSYHYGFVKRGLYGEILQLFTPGLTYRLFALLGYAFLAVEAIIICFWSYAVARKHASYPWLLSIFFFSPALLFYINTAGYLDHLCVMIAIAMALLPLRQKASAIALPLLCLLGMALHEVFFIVGFPVLILRTLLKLQLPGSRTSYYSLASAFIAITGMYLVFEYIPISAQQIADLRHSAHMHSDFPVRYDNFEVLRRGLRGNWALNFGHLPIPESLFALLKIHGAVYLPLTLFYLGLLLCIFLRPAHSAGQKTLIAIALATACLLPIASILIAWDYRRFFSLSGIVSYILLLTALHHRPPLPSLKNRRSHIAVCLVAFMNLAFPPALLMDNVPISRFPYMNHWQYWEQVWHGTATFPPSPVK